MRNIKLIIQYDGTKYKGWQRLKNTDNTIQEKIEKTLSMIVNEDIKIIGSGRTDAGVHAFGQVANFNTSSKINVEELHNYLNTYLPQDIVVLKAKEVDERFHSRYNAVSKTYLYKIWNNKNSNPFLRKYSEHIIDRLDVKTMKEASSLLIGEHDFTSFCTTKSKKKSKERKIYSIDIKRNDKIIEIKVIGNGFLHNMVRIIVGTLLEVGKGNIKPEYVKEILNKKNRSFAGPTVSAKGLYLVEVEY